MKYRYFKIKPYKEDQWRDWCKVLLMNKIEVHETLREEEVTQEVCQIKDGYLRYGMEGKCLPATKRRLNEMHRMYFKACASPTNDPHLDWTEAEILFNFKL